MPDNTIDSEDAFTLNEADEQARRLLDIVMTLRSSNGPVSSTRLHALLYPHLSDESFTRQFGRDRDRLAICGVIVRRYNKPPDLPVWSIDEASSFASDQTALSPEQEIVLDVACAELASSSSFPFSEDLTLALAKLDRSFDRRTLVTTHDLPDTTREPALKTVESALVSSQVIEMHYIDAGGTSSDCRIAPLGLFTLRGHCYVVGALVKPDGTLVEGSAKTYRTDRMAHVRAMPRMSFDCPPDFDVHDYMVLPFQLGPRLYDACLYVPADALPSLYDVLHTYSSCISIDNTSQGTFAHAAVSNERDAASWSLSQGLIPVSPQSLVSRWYELLGRTYANLKEA